MMLQFRTLGVFMNKFYIDHHRSKIISHLEDFSDSSYVLKNPYQFWNLSCLDFCKYYYFYSEWRENLNLNHLYAFITSFSSTDEMVQLFQAKPETAFWVAEEQYQNVEPFLLNEIIEELLIATKYFVGESLMQKMILVNSIPKQLVLDTLMKNPVYQEDIWNYLAPAKHWLYVLKQFCFQCQSYNLIAASFKSFLSLVNDSSVLESIYDNIFLETGIRINIYNSLNPSENQIIKLAKSIST